jgi:tripartite-type tricarboxylate transporter receptor subunit TctC
MAIPHEFDEEVDDRAQGTVLDRRDHHRPLVRGQTNRHKTFIRSHLTWDIDKAITNWPVAVTLLHNETKNLRPSTSGYLSMITKRRFLSLACMAGLTSAMPASPRSAQSQIVRDVARMLVGFAPGGSIDVVARLLANEMKRSSPSFIVDNRPGGGGRIALQTMKGAAADGSVMILTPASMIVLHPHVYRTLGYNTLQDFQPISTVCNFPFLLTVGPRVPAAVRTLADFIAWCRANPKDATYATAAAGSMLHFTGVTLARTAGFEFVHVPYPGAGGVQDLLAGQIAAGIYPIGTMLAYVQVGSLRALAQTGPRRDALLPDVPTVRELGYPQIEATEWFGVLAPARTPAETVNRLNAVICEALTTDAVKAGLAKLSYEPASVSPRDFATLIKSDFERWGPIVRASGFALEE